MDEPFCWLTSLIFLQMIPSLSHCSQLFDMSQDENLVIMKNVIELTHDPTQHGLKCVCLHAN